jgi:hypothetical protein
MGNDRGSVLIGIVIVMVIVGAMGGALLTMNSTSSVSQFGSMDGFRAFYLAESGGQYAIPVINKNIDDPPALIGLLDGHTFTFSNGDRFQLALSYAEPVYTLLSTGILDQGTRELNATRQITYRITKLGAVQIDLPFGKDNKKEFKEEFDFLGKKGKIKKVPDKKVDGKKIKDKNAEDIHALALKGDESLMRFDWDNSKNDLPNLLQIWETNQQMLSYDMQMKIRIDEDPDKKHPIPEFLVGLTFRDNLSDMYGLSFVKVDEYRDDKSLPPDFYNWGLLSGSLYVVLWKSVAGSYSLLASHEIVADDNVLVDDVLQDWSTLTVSIKESIDEDGNRLNEISGHLRGPDTYPYGTIDWDWDLHKEVLTITDSSLTTENFDATKPDTSPEMGLHIFTTKHALDKDQVYVSDFSIQFNSNSGSPSSVEQY